MSYKVYNKIPQNDFDFLIDQGLKPHHKFLDVGCGAGRIGYPAMAYLDSGNYFAFDKEMAEIGNFRHKLTNDSDPTIKGKTAFIVVDDFSLAKFRPEFKFDYLYAYSVFTHVGPDLISLFLTNIKQYLNDDAVFYATFMLGSEGCDIGAAHASRTHEFRNVWYTVEYLKELADPLGYDVEFVGDETKTWEGVERKLGDWTLTKNFKESSPWANEKRWSPLFNDKCLDGTCPAMRNGQHTHSAHQEMVKFTKKAGE
jgi:SAM-dependent methyltransferase